MVLANRMKPLQLAPLGAPDPDPGSHDMRDIDQRSRDDLRMSAISNTLSKMEDSEHQFYSKDIANTMDPHLPFSTPRSSSRPCSQRSRSSVTVPTVLNHTIPFTHKNSAISTNYASPRQFALSATVVKRSNGTDFVKQLRQQTVPSIKLRDIAESSLSSFDYDENEEEPLELVKFAKKRQRYVIETDDIYVRACAFMGITASQTYVKQVTTTHAVSMANTSLSHVTIKPIAISLVRDHVIHTLDVSGNDIGALGVIYIAQMLAVNDTIIELNLSSTMPGRAGLEELAKQIINNKSLTILRLESNCLDHTETDVLINLMRNGPDIESIFLGHNNLGYDGGKLLAKELETNTTLRTLDLQWNHFRKQSAGHLCNAIKSNKGLRHLNLSWNGLGKEGCIAMAKSLPGNKSLQHLDLTNNRIDVVALPFLLHGLVRNKGIESLHLAKNPMTTTGAKAVVKAVTGAANMRIKYLNIEDIPVDKEFTDLVRTMREKKSIDIDHGPEMYSAVELVMKEHDPHDLNRFDPVMVLMEYIRIDNLRLIDLFQFMDTGGRGLVSKDDLRVGISTLQLPLTEYHLDCIMKDIDKKRDGYIDLEEFMNAHRDMSKTIIQRTTRAKSKGKQDLGLKELKQILKELVEKRNKKNKEKASSRVKSAALARANSASSNKSSAPGRQRVRTKKASLTVTKPSYASTKKSRK
ncbi:leucine-rich repeat-containing protein 74A-like [Mya arenaria]|uniref:leucine-rich repeat-containing protein 74A-like n=1 Tax=Mya arenaria TaxID=6604 RepID=UPI0022E47DC6|nr:leucine-rich repeat-containing protein 74A-like [Mya arenaria]